MMLTGYIFGLLAYLVVGKLIVARLTGLWRDVLFAIINLTGFYWFFLHAQNDHYNSACVVYFILLVLQYGMLRAFADKPGWQPWIAFYTPIAVLVAARYLPYGLVAVHAENIAHRLQSPMTTYLVGISYVAFRSSYLALEVRNGAVPLPGLWRYFGFCLFVPTVPVGPINPYSNFCRAFQEAPPVIPVEQSFWRILVGLVKYQFLGAFFNQLGYAALLRDDHYHSWIDLPVAAVFYYFFLYSNFSGFCDMAIGGAGLMGIPVAENFDDPFAARNPRDFWNRWHITLSVYMRDVVFSPLSKFLVRWFGTANANHAIAATIFVVFLLVGVWHGVGWNFAAFGFFHGLGVVGNHYYTIRLKKWLGRDGFKAYNANRWIHAAAVALTFCYITIGLFFFANTFPEMKQIFASLR